MLEISAEDIGKEFLRAGAAEQMFSIVNYAHIPIPGDSIRYSPTPYSDASIELLSRSYQAQQSQYYN